MEVGTQGEAGPMIQVRKCEGPSEHGCGGNRDRRSRFKRYLGSRMWAIW